MPRLTQTHLFYLKHVQTTDRRQCIQQNHRDKGLMARKMKIFRQQKQSRALRGASGRRAKGNQRRNLRDLAVGVIPHCMISLRLKKERQGRRQGRRQGWQRQGQQQGQRQRATAGTTATGAPADAKTTWIESQRKNHWF